MNVAFGGSLHQKVHEAGLYQDHRERPDDPLEVQYGLSHALHVQPGGLLERLACRRRSRSIRCMGRVSSVSALVCASRRWLPTG